MCGIYRIINPMDYKTKVTNLKIELRLFLFFFAKFTNTIMREKQSYTMG